MIFLDYQDRRPIYEQVAEKFKTLIITGALPVGTKMPSVSLLWIYRLIPIPYRGLIWSSSSRD